ncbi:MAG: hypothetical protein R3183_01060 [Oleiphilaceae bacterium]|nr:hypothetical protein [Oleiphilaceae bacterium]
MAGALPHKTGGYRAYKKINGREFQFYFRDKASADKKQEELNALASLASKPPFSKCGRLLGFRIHLRNRAGRKPYIMVKVQIGPQNQQFKKDWKYTGLFEDNWTKMKSLWMELHNLSLRNTAEYAKELKAAKRLYMADVAKYEKELAEATES